MTIKGLITLLSLAVLSGCASGGGLSRQMADWQSQDVAVALEAWGTPDSQERIGDETLLSWYDRAPAIFAVADFSTPVICTRMLAVATDGTITGWRWRGDRCPDVAPGFRQRNLSASR